MNFGERQRILLIDNEMLWALFAIERKEIYSREWLRKPEKEQISRVGNSVHKTHTDLNNLERKFLSKK